MLCCTLTSRAYASPCQRSTVACRSAPSGIVVARAKNLRQQLEQQLQFEPDIPTWFTAASRWRLFGFAATACSQKQCRSADGTEYVSMAAYDLASGELFSTLINPKLHDSGYRLLPGRLQGLSREEVLSKGVNVLAAFDQLVDFVHANTPPGQTPVIVGHQGFELSFKHVEQYMRRVAAAAGTSGRGGPTSSNTGLIGGSTTDLNSSSSTASTSSSSGKGRRRRVAPVAADPSTPNTSSSTSSKGYQHSSWPQDWMFLDTYVMAQVLQSLPPSHDTRGEAFTGSTLQQMLRRCLYKQRPPAGYEFEDVHMPEVDKPRDDSLGPLADALLPPQRQHSAEPRNRALQAAINTARLAQQLLLLMQKVPEDVAGPLSDWRNCHDDLQPVLYEVAQWQHYAPWVCQPYCLNPADHSQGRFPYAATSGHCSWLEHIPTRMALAGMAAAEAVNDSLTYLRYEDEDSGYWSLTLGDGTTYHFSCLARSMALSSHQNG